MGTLLLLIAVALIGFSCGVEYGARKYKKLIDEYQREISDGRKVISYYSNKEKEI